MPIGRLGVIFPGSIVDFRQQGDTLDQRCGWPRFGTLFPSVHPCLGLTDHHALPEHSLIADSGNVTRLGKEGQLRRGWAVLSHASMLEADCLVLV